MKRVLIALITTLPLVVGVAAAQADSPTWPGLPGDPGTGVTWTPQAAVTGTVVSTDASAGTFMADAYVLTPPSIGTGGPSWGSGYGDDLKSRDTTPTTTEVNITTNGSTTIKVGGVSGAATVDDLAPGDRFLALFPGSSSDTIETLVASPATSIYAQVPKQFYAFVGTALGTNTTADTLTVDVTTTVPGSLIADGTSATFTVSTHTFIIDGSSLSSSGPGGLFGGLFGGSLSDVSTGDMVAGGLIGDAGLTAAQVEASPLMFLLDLRAPTGTTTSAANKALKETLKLLHGAKVKVKKSHGRKSHGKTKSSKKSKHAGRR